MHVDNLTFVQLALVQCSIDPLFNCPKFNYSDFQLSKVQLTSFSVVQSSIDTNVQLTFGCLTCHRVAAVRCAEQTIGILSSSP